MISIIITTYKEPKTIERAINAILEQNLKDYEILVVAPDNETLEVAKKISIKHKNIKIIKDKGEGKPSALNLVIKKAKGEILVLTDGDVYVDKKSIEKMIKKFEDKKIGAVSGRPISINDRNNKMGFWAYVLSEIANIRRKRAIKNKKRIFCSGYLFAIRKELFPILPKELLSEDGFVSHKVYSKDYFIDYSPESKVYVKYPDNFSDWIKQKKRSAGGYSQMKKENNIDIRSFKSEFLGGFELFRFIRSPKELFWLIELYLSRVYLWWIIKQDVILKKKSSKEIWERVESTK
jgi:cellulose synthase/poly-beta-1,6-N-acetylglucosamine synthase-like glycosyltransferase